MLYVGEIDGSTKKGKSFYGKKTELGRENLQYNTRVVLTLLDDLHHKGHDLYVDSGPQLAMELDTIGVTVTGSLSISYQIWISWCPTIVYTGCR